MDKQSILNNILGRGYKSNDEHLYHCPYCHHQKRKLSVNLSKNVWKCWVCDKSGRNVFHLVKRFGNSQLLAEWIRLTGQVDFSEEEDLIEKLFPAEKKEKTSIQMPLPKEFTSLVCNTSLCSIIPRNYLKSRNIEDEDINTWKMGFSTYGEYKDRIIVPSFNEDGYVNYYVGRTYKDAFFKYKNPKVEKKSIIFNELMIQWSSPVILVEGIFDAIVAGTNSIPMLGSSLAEDSLLFKKIVKNGSVVYLALDADAWAKNLSTIRKLLLYGVQVFDIKVHPFNDVGEMEKSDFRQHFNEAKEMTGDELWLLAIERV